MADKLANVKAFYYATTFDGYGIRNFTDRTYMTEGQKYIHDELLPWLYLAIVADDPAFDAHAVVMGQKPESESPDDAVVKRYILELARDGVALGRYDKGSAAYHMVFTQGQTGCYFDKLFDAMKKDDPEWYPKDIPDFRNAVLTLGQ
jgi:hypothetical protein